MDRDRGEPHDSSPPTPPYIRVRIRRFDRLSWLGTATVARPSDLNKAFDRAMASAGLLLSRQGPRGLPAVFAARARPTPQRRSFAKRVGPYLHCFQTMARSRPLVPLSRSRNTDRLSHNPK